MAEHIKLHEQSICDQKVVNMRMNDRLACFEEKVKLLELADERRKYDVHVLLKKVLPEGSQERQEAGYGYEQWLSSVTSDHEEEKKPYDPHCLDLWTPTIKFPYEQMTRGQQLISMLCKRPPPGHN